MIKDIQYSGGASSLLPRRLRSRLWRAAAGYGRICRGIVFGPRIHRTQDFVRNGYEDTWSRDNSAYAKLKDDTRILLWHKNRLVLANGWFLLRAHVSMMRQAIDQLQVKSVLEVGSGRGTNLAILARQRPAIRFHGLELTKSGVDRSNELLDQTPARIAQIAAEDAECQTFGDSKGNVTFQQGSALDMPFADNHFDFSFTILVLEQLPYNYTQTLKEMKRVSKSYCAFIEPFAEANNILGRMRLSSIDYFRFRYKKFYDLGLEPIYFTTNIPQKLKYKTGMLVTRVMG